eukprot:1587799-Prymnesium_polylepis.1
MTGRLDNTMTGRAHTIITPSTGQQHVRAAVFRRQHSGAKISFARRLEQAATERTPRLHYLF